MGISVNLSENIKANTNALTSLDRSNKYRTITFLQKWPNLVIVMTLAIFEKYYNDNLCILIICLYLEELRLDLFFNDYLV
jgi:hypothetical protein